ncbi:zinc-binding alcohol dehydrogenase family protein [Embleya sp. NPDC008237]|uniref:quinone oxidoreductase family protein n=1 Tax=Embleya sp. NPDC008237 TaxID=3363978 RepID=UPI0036E0866A
MVDLPVPVPEPGRRVLVRVHRTGVNFADVHIREGNYIADTPLPYVLGSEVVGTRDSDGRRVLALTQRGGGYAEYALAPARTTFEVPEGIEDGSALALGVQGNTAWHILHTSARLQPRESVAVFAAAGGVGTLAIQLARLAGAGRIVAAASTPAKREAALKLGADAAVDSSTVDHLTEQLIEANGGRRLDVILEMAGGTVAQAASDALADFGRLVLFGFASGRTATVDTRGIMLDNKSLIGFVLPKLYSRRDMVDHSMRELWRATLSGAITPHIGGEYPLGEVHRAHEDLQERRTTGKLVLDPTS